MTTTADPWQENDRQLSKMASLLDLPPGGPPGGRSRSRDSDETVQIALEEALGAPATAGAGESEGGPGESGVPARGFLRDEFGVLLFVFPLLEPWIK